MGIGPQALGSAGMSKNSKPCGSPLAKRGLWDNIHAKRKRIAKGSGEKMRCLLYTSPSPRDATLSRMPSSA